MDRFVHNGDIVYAKNGQYKVIAAYGEVLESIGEENGKERVMDSYRNEYKKRRLFIGELRNYGMKN